MSEARVSTASLPTGVPQLAHDRAAGSSFDPQAGHVGKLFSATNAGNILPRLEGPSCVARGLSGGNQIPKWRC